MSHVFRMNKLRAAGYEEFAELIESDLAEHFNAFGNEPIPAPPLDKRSVLLAAIKGVIADHHPARGFTYPEMVELVSDRYGFNDDKIASLTWVATMREAGLRKLGVELSTRHGSTAVYCRVSDAAELSVLSATELRNEMSPGIIVAGIRSRKQPDDRF